MKINEFEESDYIYQDQFQKIEDDRPRRKRKKRSCLRFCGCSFLAILLVLILVYASLAAVIGPAFKKIDQLPGDLAAGFSIYRAGEAVIKIQDQAGQEKIYNLIQFLPNWALEPLWRYVEKKTNLASDLSLPDNLSAEEIKAAMSQIDLSKLKTVSWSWDALDKTKEDLSAYYKSQLENNGFQFQENIADYDINLNFWKEDSFGSINLADTDNASSAAKILINYLEK